MEELNATGRMHKVIMTNRRTCTVNGVNDVLSFDLREILLETEQGMLMIRGNELHVNRLTLDKGEVDIDGRIDSFVYSDTAASGEKQESFLGRLFRWWMRMFSWHILFCWDCGSLFCMIYCGYCEECLPTVPGWCRWKIWHSGCTVPGKFF